LQEWLTVCGVTPAEGRVIELLEKGLTNAEIAELLGTASTTVRNQLASIFRKLFVSTRAELVACVGQARRGGMPPPSTRSVTSG
jgi:DNA-binding NarL/FixJ family response regulator